MDAERDRERPHPNDPQAVRAHLERSATLMSDEEREDLARRIDAAIAKIDERLTT
jgi:hypothetical protein